MWRFETPSNPTWLNFLDSVLKNIGFVDRLCRRQSVCQARECAIADAVENAKRILEKIDERWPSESILRDT
jgi:hypothetical protein